LVCLKIPLKTPLNRFWETQLLPLNPDPGPSNDQPFEIDFSPPGFTRHKMAGNFLVVR
jgi:hypothetical protein